FCKWFFSKFHNSVSFIWIAYNPTRFFSPVIPCHNHSDHVFSMIFLTFIQKSILFDKATDIQCTHIISKPYNKGLIPSNLCFGVQYCTSSPIFFVFYKHNLLTYDRFLTFKIINNLFSMIIEFTYNYERFYLRKLSKVPYYMVYDRSSV